MDKIPSPTREDPRANDPPVREQVRPETRDAIRIVDDGRQRQFTGDTVINPYDIDDICRLYKPTNGDPAKGNIDNEIDFEWKRYEIYGEKNYAEWNINSSQGWKPALHENFPGRFAPAGQTGMIIVKDMVLMHRPMRLTVQARNEELAKASRQMQAHRQTRAATPVGGNERFVLADRTSRESIEIPE